jgi:hypothetical protein
MRADRAVPLFAATDNPMLALWFPFPFAVIVSQGASVVAVHAQPVSTVS